MELPRWDHKPLHCMVCADRLPLHRRAAGSWFCSRSHQRWGIAAGVADRAQEHRAKADWDHDRNPIDATSCYFCGYTIGPVRRIQGHIYCSEECYLAHHIHQTSEPNTGRRDALVATGVMGIAGAMLLLDRRGGPTPNGTKPLSGAAPSLIDLSRFAPTQAHAAALSFKTEDGLKLWLAARDAWRAAGDAMQPLSSVLYAGVQQFRSGMMELTTRGGAGMMLSATPDLSAYHFVAFRPVQAGGGIVDYSLDYGTRADARLVHASSRRLRLPLDLARNQTTFRVEKRGPNLEAYLEIGPGHRRWLNKWEEKTLPDGRVGLYVGEGHRYSVIAGRIEADEAL